MKKCDCQINLNKFQLDDDVFLNVAKINKIEAWNNHDSISGFVNADVIPIRQAVLNDPLELYKWICPKWMFSGETYPNYTAGYGNTGCG